MKRVILALLFLLMLASAMGNPPPTLFVSKFWFDDNDVLQLRFSHFAPYYGATSIDLFDGTNHIVRQIDLTVPANLLQSYPEAAVTPQQGSFVLSWGDSIYEQEAVSWGSSITNDLSPISAEECGMQVYIAESWENTVKMWAKELKVYPDSELWPTTNSVLDLACYDFSGAPQADIPFWAIFLYTPWGYTGADGHYNEPIISTKLHIQVKHPATQEVVCDTTFFAEPNQTYPMAVHFYHVGVDDPVTPVAFAALNIYPSVLRISQSTAIKLDYAGKLDNSAMVELFDLKGRLISKENYSGSGMEWQLPSLSSGVYFVNLVSSGKSTGKAKLIVLK